MFLKEFDTPTQRFNKIQKILRENYNCEIAVSKIKANDVSKLYNNSANKLQSINESKNPKQFAKLHLVTEGLKLLMDNSVSIKLNEDIESAVEEAKVIIAAQNMKDKLQKIIEDLAQMQVQDLMPIIDSMKEEIGANEAARFNSAVDSALGELLNSAKETKDKMENAILIASGESGGDMMSADDMMPDEPRIDGQEALDVDDFGGEDSAAGDIGPESRAMKGESIEYVNALSEMKSKSKDNKIKKSDVEAIKSKRTK